MFTSDSETKPGYGLPSPIVPFGANSSKQTKLQIDQIPPKSREREKLQILSDDDDYLDFLQTLTGLETDGLKNFLNDLYEDNTFWRDFLPRLALAETYSSLGDLRFHAVTIYTVVRARQPEIVVETGVAHGKSSAFILLGLEHNGYGQLYSVDVPATGEVTLDGSNTSLSGREPGWLVPDGLRHRWSLTLTDSLEFLQFQLPQLIATHSPGSSVSLFLHDSLHTFDHVDAELRLISPLLSRPAAVCVDNVDMPGGRAFEEYLTKLGRPGASYTDFAGCGFV